MDVRRTERRARSANARLGAVAVLVGAALFVLGACGGDAECGVGDACACAFDSDCPDRRLEFCDRAVGTCQLRDEPLPEEDAGADVGVDVAPPAEACGNGIDDDLDGAIDCEDPSCFADDACGTSVYWYAATSNINGLPSVSLGATDGRAAVPVVDRADAHVTRDPTFDADGTRLAVAYADSERTALLVLPLTGGAAQVIDAGDLTRATSPAFSGDGTALWVVGTVPDANGDRSVIRQLAIEDGAVRNELRALSTTVTFASVRELEDRRVIALVSERVGDSISSVTGDLATLDFERGALVPWIEGLRLTGRMQPAPGGVLLYSASRGRLVFVPSSAASAEDVQDVASRDDSSCAPLSDRLAVCIRSFAAVGEAQTGDVALVDWQSGELVRRVTDTPDASEGGVASHPETEGREVSGFPADLPF